MSEWECLRWTEDDRKTILQVYDRTPDTVKGDIAAIREWMRKQPHLARYEPQLLDHQIEMTLLFNKFRVETSKAKIDVYVSIRKFFPSFFGKMHNRHLEKSYLSTYVLTLPHLTGDNARVYVSRLNEPHRDLFDVNDYMTRILKMGELRSRYDCCLYDYYVIDCKWITMATVTQFTPIVCKNIVTVLEKLFSLRCHGIYLLNAPRFVEKVIVIFRKLLKKKLADRIHVSETDEIIRDLLPLSKLPSEYGGDGASLAELSNAWRQKYDEIEDWLEYLWANPPDDALRTGDPLDCEYFGVDGNFRRLDVD